MGRILCQNCKYYSSNKPVENGKVYDGTCTRLDTSVNVNNFCKKAEERYID